jgi:hypothetical protein
MCLRVSPVEATEPLASTSTSYGLWLSVYSTILVTNVTFTHLFIILEHMNMVISALMKAALRITSVSFV